MTNQILTVTTLCHILSVTSVSSHDNNEVFSLAVTYDNQEVSVHFSMDKFTEFYRCLCKTTTTSCTAYANLHKVTYIHETVMDAYQKQLYMYYNRHICQHVRYENAVTCSKLQLSQVNCSNTQNCLTYRLPKEVKSTCSQGKADLVWKLGQHVSGSYVYGLVEVHACQPECDVVNRVTGTSVDNTSLTPSFNASTVLPFVDIMNRNITMAVNATKDESSRWYNSSDQTSVVIGLLMGSFIVISFLVIIGAMVWRRRRSALLTNTNKDSSPITNTTPTLIQLHHIDMIYANNDSMYTEANMSNGISSTEPDVVSYWSAEFSDFAEYQPGMSEFYNGSHVSLDMSHSQIYENYSKPMAICLCRSDRNRSLDGSCIQNITDDLIYEDVDRSGFENAPSDADESEDSQYGNVTRGERFSSTKSNSVKKTSSSKMVLGSSKPGLENSRDSNLNCESHPKNGYSKLNEQLPIIKESYNSLSSSLTLADRHGGQLDRGVVPSDINGQSSDQPVRYSLTYDSVDVIEVSPSPKLHNKVSHGSQFINDTPEQSTADGKRRLVYMETSQRPKSSHFKKVQAYFELESQFEHKKHTNRPSVDIPADVKAKIKPNKAEKHRL